MFQGNVLVHCLMGMSRSATLVIAFLMKKRNKTVLEAFKEVSFFQSMKNSRNSCLRLNLQEM